MNDFFVKILKPVIDNIEKYSDRNAFCIDGTFFKYSDFGKAISKIRQEVKKIDKDVKRIGVVGNDDLETYASFFALWLENKCYVPLSPMEPISRCLQIIDEVSVPIILDSSHLSVYPENLIVPTNQLAFSITDYVYENKGSDDDLAYILFTSGSTGIPKAVPISRNNLLRFIESMVNEAYKLTFEDKCLQCNNLNFDVSLQAYLYPLLFGACIYTVPHNQIGYSYIYDLLENHKLTNAIISPSVIRYLRPYFNEIYLPALKYCSLGGEGLPMDLLNEWAKCIPNAIIENLYGPTEITIYCIFARYNRSDISANKAYNGIFHIGKPFAQIKKLIVDSENNELPIGIHGELCLAGNQLTQGYLNNDEKNADSFFLNEGIRYHKTGDICFIDEEGDIMFVGRMDSQVQIYGIRVELGEIEFYARKLLDCLNIYAMAVENSIGNMEVVLIIESEPFDANPFTKGLRQLLPSHMVPRKILFVSQFPLNNNGKIDRKKLIALIKR